ncbi:hypothetical protein [Kitasatospora sp. NPDC087315]|uniref:hypothetical protein n=1 Tax=Kitasatospora sp. NPDC087315 TaxID=3364069 RepID=UPI0037FFA8C9
MNLLTLRHRVHMLLGGEAEQHDSDITTVTMSNPVQAGGPWAIVVTTADQHTLRLTFTDTGTEYYTYRAEIDHFNGIALGTYTSPADARLHIETHYTDMYGPMPMRWSPEIPKADEPQTLYVTKNGREWATSCRVMPVPVRDCYDPDAEE